MINESGRASRPQRDALGRAPLPVSPSGAWPPIGHGVLGSPTGGLGLEAAPAVQSSRRCAGTGFGFRCCSAGGALDQLVAAGGGCSH